VNASNSDVELFKRRAQRTWKIVGVRLERRCVGSKDSEIDLAIEESDSEAVARQRVPMRAGLTPNEAAEPETSEVIGHLCRRIARIEERCNARAQISMAKADGQMRKASEGLQERQYARIAKTKRPDALVPDAKRLLETVEGVGRQGAMVADAFDRQERAIDVIAQRPQGRQLVQAFGEAEIVRIVDREFAA